MSLAWTEHPAAEAWLSSEVLSLLKKAFLEFSLKAPEVVDGSFYLRDRAAFENQEWREAMSFPTVGKDLDMLHDVELLGRCLLESLEPKLGEFGLDWDKVGPFGRWHSKCHVASQVVILGFGKGAGISLYASLLNIFPKQVSAMVLFSWGLKRLEKKMSLRPYCVVPLVPGPEDGGVEEAYGEDEGLHSVGESQQAPKTGVIAAM